ncbi:hypothetical protein PCHDK_000263300 [Plasmodium chabaudi adami]|uniref:Uncharacterized protein n=1 Tax=Plasmodium chabaudi adami TaxID=5826 RepID=A0A1D3LL21_PLACE|nr:hypothetical protein PCHDK_000263300 [Plasmodium chabaudi adami]
MFIGMQDDLNKCVKSNKKVNDEHEINNIDINNNENIRYRSLSECVVEDNYTLGFTTIKEPSADKQNIEWEDFLHNLVGDDQENLESLLRIKEKILKESSNSNESLSMVPLLKKDEDRDYYAKNLKLLKLLFDSKKAIKILPSNDKQVNSLHIIIIFK